LAPAASRYLIGSNLSHLGVNISDELHTVGKSELRPTEFPFPVYFNKEVHLKQVCRVLRDSTSQNGLF
jgi:hypothetical protein